jgi:hypothetical protein
VNDKAGGRVGGLIATSLLSGEGPHAREAPEF